MADWAQAEKDEKARGSQSSVKASDFRSIDPTQKHDDHASRSLATVPLRTIGCGRSPGDIKDALASIPSKW
jgi:hypothetical protein